MTSLESELHRKRKLLKQKENAPLAKLEETVHQARTISGKYLSDIVLGANDGIITTFAVIAGARGASLSSGVIIILGLANLLADGISMGAGNYLGAKSEIDYQKKQRKKEEWEVENFPEIEEQEIRDIFAKKGFEGNDLERAVEIIISDKKRWIDTMMLEELHLIEEPHETPIKRGLITFIAFVIAGAVPVLPFLFPIVPPYRFAVAAIVSGITMFTVGALRSKVIVKQWFAAGIEMLMVGTIAALAAYSIGALLQSVVNVGAI